MEKLGIQDLKEVLEFGLGFGTAYQAAIADGKFDWSDAIHLIPLAQKAGPAIDNVQAVVEQIRDIDAEERAELEAIVEKFDLPSERLEKLIEASLRSVLAVGELVALATKKEEAEAPADPAPAE